MAASKVTDLRKRRIERLAVDLARELVSTTYLIVEVDEIDSVDEWRWSRQVDEPWMACTLPHDVR